VVFQVSARSQTATTLRKEKVPAFRLRVNESTGQVASLLNIESINENSVVPTFQQNQRYSVWFPSSTSLNTRTLNVAQCFRVTPSTPVVLIVLPLPPGPLTQGAFVASTETHSVQVSSARKGVSHRLQQPTLHLPWDSLVSQPFPNDFSAFPFSGEEVARPCIR
jgi:hypothetical protein